MTDNTLTTQQMAAPEVEAPETIEGYWVLHDFRRIDWPRWRSLPEAARSRLLEELLGFLGECASVEGVERGGSSRAYRVITQKADLAVIHFRPDPAQLFDLQRGSGGAASPTSCCLPTPTSRSSSSACTGGPPPVRR